MYEVYKHTLPTNSSYIGYTGAGWKSRLYGHFGSDSKFGRVLSNFKISDITTEILYKTDSLIEAKDVERFYIKWFNAVETGYNQIYAASGPSEIGKQRISNSMLGKVIVRDKDTGELMGKHLRTHPKIISGEWVHHTKGFTHALHPITKRRIWIPKSEVGLYEKWIPSTKAEKNGKYSGYNRERIIKIFLEYCLFIEEEIKDKTEFSGNSFNRYALKHYANFPNFPGCLKVFRFPELEHTKLKGIFFMINQFLSKEKQTYFLKLVSKKSKEHRRNMSVSNLNKNKGELNGN